MVTLIWTSDAEFYFDIEGYEEVCILKFSDGKVVNLDLNNECQLAAMLFFEMNKSNIHIEKGGFVYTREGMIKRVLLERKIRAEKLVCRIKLGSCLYGPHTLIEENGIRYDIIPHHTPYTHHHPRPVRKERP